MCALVLSALAGCTSAPAATGQYYAITPTDLEAKWRAKGISVTLDSIYPDPFHDGLSGFVLRYAKIGDGGNSFDVAQVDFKNAIDAQEWFTKNRPSVNHFILLPSKRGSDFPPPYLIRPLGGGEAQGIDCQGDDCVSWQWVAYGGRVGRAVMIGFSNTRVGFSTLSDVVAPLALA